MINRLAGTFQQIQIHFLNHQASAARLMLSRACPASDRSVRCCKEIFITEIPEIFTCMMHAIPVHASTDAISIMIRLGVCHLPWCSCDL